MLNRFVPVAPSAISQSREASIRESASVIWAIREIATLPTFATAKAKKQIHIPHEILWSTSSRRHQPLTKAGANTPRPCLAR
jgi:hypothetical protein